MLGCLGEMIDDVAGDELHPWDDCYFCLAHFFLFRRRGRFFFLFPVSSLVIGILSDGRLFYIIIQGSVLL